MSTRDHPDWWRPVGGSNAQDSTLERRSLAWNDDGIVAPTVPANYYTGGDVEAKGKFFTRGMRGMIEQIQVYTQGAPPGTVTLRFSPHPSLGYFHEVVVPYLAAWAWYQADFEEMWDYDSLFIWVHEFTGGNELAYDTEEPYDGHDSPDLGATWEDLDVRPFIRVVYSGQTPGDVPVSGIINNIAIPSSSSVTKERDVAVPADAAVTILTFYGAGYCDYIEALVTAAVNSHLTYIRVYCDRVLAMEEQFDELNTYGHTTATPTVSLPSFGEDSRCYMLIHKRFEFRRVFTINAYNLPSPQTVTVTAHPTFLR